MYSYIYMKILESSPKRYDMGINILSLGNADKIKREITDKYIKQGDKVLEIGCGTGVLCCMMAKKGAVVEGFDISQDMLAIARKRAQANNLNDKITLRQLSIAEIDLFEENYFDKIVSTLVFSEFSHDEIAYALKEGKRILKDDGLFIIADETLPTSYLKRILYYLIRLPLLIVTFAIAQATTKPIVGLKGMLKALDFETLVVSSNILGSFELIVGKSNRGGC